MSKNYVELTLHFPELKELQKLIDPSDLSSYGLQDSAHITLLYGLDDSVEAEDVQKIIDKVKLGPLKTGKVSFFPDSGVGEVLKFEINSQEIFNINKLLQQLPHPGKTHDFNPHITIAYLKKGQAKKYVEDERFNSTSFDLNPKDINYSKNKIKTKLKLNESIYNTHKMNNIIKNWNSFLNEQTEPYQKKMKAKHSRLKKRVIGHGGQKAGPPYSEKPSMERSKSAPPMGESLEEQFVIEERITRKGKQYCLKSKKGNKNLGCYDTKAGVEKRERQVQYFKHMDEGLFDFFKKKQPEEPADEYKEAPQAAKGYTFLTDKLAVGAAPMKYGILSKNALSTFDKIYVMSDQVADLLLAKDKNTLEANKDKVILMPIADIDQPIDDREAEKLIEHDKEIIKAINAVEADLNNPSIKKILVTCSMGLNRSATVAAGALVKGGLDPEEAIELVKNRRGDKALSLDSKPHQRFINTIRSQKKVEESIRRVIRRLIREQYGRKRYA
jgi:hypothetical protein